MGDEYWFFDNRFFLYHREGQGLCYYLTGRFILEQCSHPECDHIIIRDRIEVINRYCQG